MSKEKIITERGYWECSNPDIYKFDRPLADAIIAFLKSKGEVSVLDLGCGNGDYTNHFLRNGIHARGCDGNSHTPEIAGAFCTVCDLTQPIGGGVADWVMSLEVAEHIPKKYEEAFLDNIDGMNRQGIILSWAIPGQGGHGHVNERPNDYVVDVMISRGYTLNLGAIKALREASTLPWFGGTIMVFERKSMQEDVISTQK